MAGLFAVRSLRAANSTFDPFGEVPSDSDNEPSDDGDVEEAGEITSDDERLAMSKPVQKADGTAAQSHWEVDHAAEVGSSPARFDEAVKADDAAVVKAAAAVTVSSEPAVQLQARWEAVAEEKYEDEDAEVFCVRFSPDDRLLAAGCGDGVVRIYHAEDGRAAYTLEREGLTSRMPTTCLRFRPEAAGGKTRNVLLVANADGTVQHWHITSRKCLHTISEVDHLKGGPNQVYALDYRPDGAQFATAGKDYAVRVYDEATKSVVSSLCAGFGKPSAGHSNRVFSLKFVPDEPHLLLSAGWDNTIQVWDLRTAGVARSLYGPHVCGDSIDVSGHEIVSGSWRPNSQLQIWDLRSCELGRDVRWRPGLADASKEVSCSLYAAQFTKPSSSRLHGAGLIAAGGSGANELKLFDRESDAVVARMKLPRGVYGLDFAHDGRSLAVAGGDCIVRVLEVPNKQNPTGRPKRAPAQPGDAAPAPAEAAAAPESPTPESTGEPPAVAAAAPAAAPTAAEATAAEATAAEAVAPAEPAATAASAEPIDLD